MLFSIAMTAGRLGGDAVTARLGDRTVMFWGGLLATAGFVVLLTAPIAAMARRLQTRIAFGKRISEHSVWEERLARARIDIEMSRLLCLQAADLMDKQGNKAARIEISMIKVQAPGKRILTTQLYFPGDASNRRDGLYRPELEMKKGREAASFDFVVEA